MDMISNMDINRYFWEGLDDKFRERVEARMLVTNPHLDVSIPFSVADITDGADYLLNPNRFDQHLTTRSGYQSSESETEEEKPPKKTRRRTYQHSSDDESEDDPKPLTQSRLPITPPMTPKSTSKHKKSKTKDEDFKELVEGMSQLDIATPTYWAKYVQFVHNYPQLKDLVEPPLRRNGSGPNNPREPFQRDPPPHQRYNQGPRPPFNPNSRPPFNPNPRPPFNQPPRQPFNPPSQQPFKPSPQQSFNIATGPNAIGQNFTCFGCGNQGHHIRQCEELDKLIKNGQIIRDPVNGLLRWPDGSRIYRSGNETWVQAVTRNTPVKVNFAEVVTFEPSLETACNYVGIEREEGDASTDEQEEALGWTSGEVVCCNAVGAMRTEGVSKAHRKEVQKVSPGRTQGVKKLPRSRKVESLGGPDTPLQNDVHFHSDKARIPIRPTFTDSNQGIIKGKTDSQLLPKEVDQKVAAKPANNNRKDPTHKGKASGPIVPNTRSTKAKDGLEIAKKILGTNITLTVQEAIDTAPALRRTLVNAMKPTREVSSPVQESTGFLGQVIEESDPSEEVADDQLAQEPDTDTDEGSNLNRKRVSGQSGRRLNGLIKIPVKVEGTMMTGIFDSGSQINIVNQGILEKAGIPWLKSRKYQIPLMSVDGTVTRCAGMLPQAKMIVETNQGLVLTMADLYVKGNTGFQLLLGRDWGVENAANWVEAGSNSYIEIETDKGPGEIIPLSCAGITCPTGNYSTGSPQEYPASVYMARISPDLEEGEVADSENEEGELEIESNRAQVGAEILEERKNDFFRSPILIRREDPPTPGQRQRELTIDEEEELIDRGNEDRDGNRGEDRSEADEDRDGNRGEDRSEAEEDLGDAEERRGTERESSASSDPGLNRPATECIIQAELHETYIDLVQKGASNDEWRAFCKLEATEMEHDRNRWRTLRSKNDETPNSTTTGSPEANSPEPLRYPVSNSRSSEEWEPGPEPSQTLGTNPEPTPNPPTTQKRKKNLENEDQPTETQLRRSKRTRRTTEKAEGDEFKNYIHSYQRKERQERKCARGRGAIMASGICSFVAEVVPGDNNGGPEEEDKGEDLKKARAEQKVSWNPTKEGTLRPLTCETSQVNLEPEPEEPNDPGNEGDEGEDLEESQRRKKSEHEQSGEADNKEPTQKIRTLRDTRTEDEDEDEEGPPMERRKPRLEAAQPVAEPEERKQKGKSTTHPEEDQPRRTLRRSDHSQRIGLTPREPLYDPGRKALNDGELEGMTTGTGSQPIPEDACPKKEGLSFENSKSGNSELNGHKDEEGQIEKPREEDWNEWLRKVKPKVAGLVIPPPESQELNPRNNPSVRKGKAKMRGVDKEWIRLGPDDRMVLDNMDERPSGKESLGHPNVPQDVMENVYPGGPDPLEGVPLLGINYHKSRTARNGLLASKEIVLFADDSLLRQCHFFAKDVTLATRKPSGKPSYFHGDATIRIDAPEPGQQILVPRPERVSKAREYVFNKKGHIRSSEMHNPVVTSLFDEANPRREISWALMTPKELENLLADLNARPMEEDEEVRTYTIHPKHDGTIQVQRGIERKNGGNNPLTPEDKAPSQEKDDKEVSRSDEETNENKEGALTQKGSDPPTPDRAPKLEARVLENGPEGKNGRDGDRMETIIQPGKDGPPQKQENNQQDPDIKAEEATHQEDSPTPTPETREQVTTEPTTYGECGCGCRRCPELMETTPQSQVNPAREQDQSRSNRPPDLSQASVPREDEILRVEIPPPNQQSPGIMVAAHLTELKEEPLPQGERSFFAFGATIVAGEEGRFPYVHQGQAYVHLYSSSLDSVVNLPPLPPQNQVIAARDNLFFDHRSGGLIPQETLQVPRNTPFMDQPVVQDVAVGSAIGPEIPAIQEEIKDIEMAMAKLKALTNGEDLCPQDTKAASEQVSGGKEIFSCIPNPDNHNNDLAWPGYPSTVDPRTIAMNVEDEGATPTDTGHQPRISETTKDPRTIDTPPIAFLETTPDPPTLCYPDEIQIDELAADDEPMPDAPKLVPGRGVDPDPTPNPPDTETNESHFSEAIRMARDERQAETQITKEELEELVENATLVEQYIVYCIMAGLPEDIKECLTSIGLKTTVIEMRQERKEGIFRDDYWTARIGLALMERRKDVDAYVKKLDREGWFCDTDMDGPLEGRPPKETSNGYGSSTPEIPKIAWNERTLLDEDRREKIETLVTRTIREILESNPKPIATNNAVVSNAVVPATQNRSDLAKLEAFLNGRDPRSTEVAEGLAEMGLLQITYDIGDLRTRGIMPDEEYWGRKAAEAMKERKERIDRFLARKEKGGRRATEAKSSLPQIKEEPEEVDVKEAAPIDWYPEVTAYVPASPMPGNPEAVPYVPKSPDPDGREVPRPDPATERRNWEEIKQQLDMLEERIDTAITDLKTRMRELDDQVFRDGCLLTELNWKAEELKKMENQAKANRKRTHRRNDPKSQHEYQTRSVTAAREKLADTQKQLDKVIGRITALEDRTEAALAEIESIKRKIDKITGLTPEVKALAKVVEDHRKAQQDLNSVLMSEIASIKLALGPTIESKLKTQSIAIDQLTSRVNQLHQVAMTLLTSTDHQYASSYTHDYATPYAGPCVKNIPAF